MANNRFVGGAALTPQVTILTIAGTAAASQTYTVAIGLRSIVYTSSNTDTNATITSSVLALLQEATTWGEFTENSFALSASSTTAIVATGPETGAPVTISGSASGTGTLTVSTATAASSTNDVSIAANWSTGSLPGVGDNVSFDHTGNDALWNLQHFNGVNFASLSIPNTFEAGEAGTGTMGLPVYSGEGTSQYVQYRPTSFQCAPTTCVIGEGEGEGSGRIKLDFGTATVNVVVNNTGSALETDLESVLVKGGSNTSTATIVDGSVALAGLGGDTATFQTVLVGDGGQGGPALRLGAGSTVTTLKQQAGNVTCESCPTTITKTGGNLTVLAGACTTLTAQSGTSGSTAWLSTGEITTLLARELMDFSQDGRGRTVGTATFQAGAGLQDPLRTVTWTNPITLQNCGIEDMTAWDVGKNIELVITNL